MNRLLLIAIGGTLHRRSQTFNGILALDMLQAHNLHFDVAFIAASGVSAEAGVTNASLEEISIKRYAVAAASRRFCWSILPRWVSLPQDALCRLKRCTDW